LKNNFSVKIRPVTSWKLWIFLLQFWKIYGILWFNLFKILDLDTKNLFTHFCFLNFWFWKKNRFADFFLGPLSTKKIYKFSKNIEKIPFRRVAQIKVQFCTRRHKSHFFYSPCICPKYSLIFWYFTLHFMFRKILK